MGSFYTNFTLKSANADAVVSGLKAAGRSALVTPASGGCVLVFDEECDQQSTATIEELGATLSADNRCPVLAMLNHDDDILCYWLFDGGVQIDAYNSCPEYFDDTAGEDRGGNASLLCQTLGVPESAEGVKSILDGDAYVFAMERHAALVEALHLPEWGVSAGFNYLSSGELPDGLAAEDLLRSP